MNENEKEVFKNTLEGFISTGTYYKHYLGPFYYTDGVKYLMEKAEAHWLIDAIFCYGISRRFKSSDFQIWKLKVNSDRSAVLTMREDSGLPAKIRQKIEWTDFPLSEITIYVQKNAASDDEVAWVACLPSEY